MLVLERFCYGPEGTFGYLRLPGMLTLYTVEQAWRENRRNESCIPEGRYPLVRDTTGRWQHAKIPDGDVPGGRTAIELHPANRASDLLGCIAPGLELGVVRGEWAVLESAEACERVCAYLDGCGGSDGLWVRQFESGAGAWHP